jgi:hypothetical protein
VEGHIHSREIGLIQVKGFAEAVKVFEPYEISLDLAEELDPLKAKGNPAGRDSQDTARHPGNRSGNSRVALDRATLSYLVETFSRLNGLCFKAEKNQVSFGEVRKELAKRWGTLRAALLKGAHQ